MNLATSKDEPLGEGQEVLSEESTRTPKSRGLGSSENCARSTGAKTVPSAATAATSPPGAAEAGMMIFAVQTIPPTLRLRADEVIALQQPAKARSQATDVEPATVRDLGRASATMWSSCTRSRGFGI